MLFLKLQTLVLIRIKFLSEMWFVMVKGFFLLQKYTQTFWIVEFYVRTPKNQPLTCWKFACTLLVKFYWTRCKDVCFLASSGGTVKRAAKPREAWDGKIVWKNCWFSAGRFRGSASLLFHRTTKTPLIKQDKCLKDRKHIGLYLVKKYFHIYVISVSWSCPISFTFALGKLFASRNR